MLSEQILSDFATGGGYTILRHLKPEISSQMLDALFSEDNRNLT